MPAVIVQVVTFNSGATIDRCLDSVFAQHFTDFEVVIVDNASRDDSVERVRRWDLPLVVNKANLGYAAAHNQALGLQSSQYVLTLNPDARLDSHFLESMVGAMERDDSCGSAAGCLLRVDSLDDAPYCIDGAGLYMRRNRRQGLRMEKAPVEARPTTPTPIFGPDGAAAFYRRAMLDDVCLNGEVFDSDFFMHKEDIDLCWRAQLRGWRALYVPDAIAHHIRGFRPGVRANMPAVLRFYGTRNRYLLMLKNELPGPYLRDLWSIGLYDAGIAAYILVRERDTARVYPSLIALTRRMLKKRHAIQAGRRVGAHEMDQWFHQNGHAG